VFTYLLTGFEYVTLEDVASAISCDVTEDLQVLGVVRHVEYPVGNDKTEESAVKAQTDRQTDHCLLFVSQMQ
jgi:hypothetical protein